MAMPTPADLIAIARDIAQESCLRIPVRLPGQVAHWQRHGVLFAAKAVKEMCNNANERDGGVANLILYAALVVEYAANVFAKNSNSHRKISEPENPRLLDKMEYIKDVLKAMEPGYYLDAETLKADLIEALARDLGVDNSQREVNQFIESSFVRHCGGPQEAENYLRRNPNWDRGSYSDVHSLGRFLNKHSVSLLALRSESAVKFLDILEMAARSDSVATPGEKRPYQTYLRRLSYRSGQYPTAFRLNNVTFSSRDCEPCTHSRKGSHEPTEGGYGKVCYAKWKEPGRDAVHVAIKTFKDSDSRMIFHEAAFWYYLDPEYVVPFYGVVDVNNLPRLVSLWMAGGRICCYADKKEDSIRLDLLHQVANGIKYLHDLNFVHCDIKPENILIDTQKWPRALITDFGFSNTARRTNVAHSKSYGYTPGYVPVGSNNITPWDPSNDIYAFGVTCCQVVLVNRWSRIDTIPEDINTCHVGSAQQIVGKLRQKFFPLPDKPPPAFFQEIFDVVANTCSVSTCKMDDVIDLLKRAYAACLRYEGAQGHGPWPIAPRVPSVGRHGQRQLPPQVENGTGYDEGHGSRSESESHAPLPSRPLCRFPRCIYYVFFDSRVNEYREWCGDQHMQGAITYNLEKACDDCGVWPRRKDQLRCSGNVCRYPSRQLPPQIENATGYDEGHGSRSESHAALPSRPLCRFPRCFNPVFFDSRVNELREWCGDRHMQGAITYNLEKACDDCGVWPRRKDQLRCSGNVCRYPRS